MTSPARIAANRRNALKSTGPRTPQGKRAVRLNALWHGAFATDPVLPGEDRAAFAALLEDFHRSYQPASPEEEEMIRRMVLSAWRLERLAVFETRVLVDGSAAKHAAASSDPIASAFIADSAGPNNFGKLARYQTTMERAYHRARLSMQELQAMTHADSHPRKV